jgi:ABC-type phosphate transport system substrate-binding protein
LQQFGNISHLSFAHDVHHLGVSELSVHRKAATLTATAVLGLAFSASIFAQAGRDYVYVVGSSTVYPFATVVAERFGRSSEFKTPKIESTGSGGGLKLFCDGVGVDYPDVTNSSRPIKSSEVETCAENGVTEIIEVKIGYDGIVFANAISADTMKLSRADIFLALAKEVPGDAEGELIENPYTTWADVNPELPATERAMRSSSSRWKAVAKPRRGLPPSKNPIATSTKPSVIRFAKTALSWKPAKTTT